MRAKIAYRVVKWPWGGYAVQKLIVPIHSTKPMWVFADTEAGPLDSDLVIAFPTEDAAHASIAGRAPPPPQGRLRR